VRAALRTADQRRGRLPTRCVKTGAPTDGAVHTWAVERRRADVLWLVLGPVLRVGGRSERIVLPLAPAAWSALRRGLGAAVVVAGLGAGALGLGLVQGDPGLVVLGSLLLVGAWVVRALVLWRRWVGVVLRPDGKEIALSRVSPEFGEEARALFIGSALPPRR